MSQEEALYEEWAAVDEEYGLRFNAAAYVEYQDFLGEPAEDIDAFLERVNNGETTEKENDEFALRLIRHFIDAVDAGESPRPWVMKYLADQFWRVLHGAQWENEFALPWIEGDDGPTQAERLGVAIFCDVVNARRINPRKNVTQIIEDIGQKYNVAYRTARSHYYGYLKLMKARMSTEPEEEFIAETAVEPEAEIALPRRSE